MNTTETVNNPNQGSQNVQGSQTPLTNQSVAPQNNIPNNNFGGGGQPQFQQQPQVQPNYSNYGVPQGYVQTNQPGYQPQVGQPNPNNKLNPNQQNLGVQNVLGQTSQDKGYGTYDASILDRIKEQEPQLYSYIRKDQEEKLHLKNQLRYQGDIIEGLRYQLKKFNDISILAQEGFKPNEHELINKICEGNITPEKLQTFKQQKELSFLRDEMAIANERRVNQEENPPLFAKYTG